MIKELAEIITDLRELSADEQERVARALLHYLEERDELVAAVL
jgi:hypothetical protein